MHWAPECCTKKIVGANAAAMQHNASGRINQWSKEASELFFVDFQLGLQEFLFFRGEITPGIRRNPLCADRWSER